LPDKPSVHLIKKYTQDIEAAGSDLDKNDINCNEWDLTIDKFFKEITRIAEEDDGDCHANRACEHQGPEQVSKRAFPQQAQHKNINLFQHARCPGINNSRP